MRKAVGAVKTEIKFEARGAAGQRREEIPAKS